MKKNVVFAMIAIMGISLSACGNKVEEAANTETVETVSNEEIVKETPTPATVSDATESTSEEVIEIPETDVPETVETSTSTETTELGTLEETPTPTASEPTTSTTNSTTSDSSSNVSAADMETLYQENLHKWTTGTTWKASNGVELKINDAHADAVKAGDLGSPAAIWYEDPDRDPTPNSPYMNALAEFIYGTDEAYLNGKDRWNPEVVDISKLPDIPLASSKQTSVVETDESRAYKEAYDTMYGFQATGKWEANPAVLLQFGFDGGKGIGLTADGAGYIWTLEYNGSEWVLTINKNLGELQWDGLHNSLRLVSPDGDAVYNAIYRDMYISTDNFPEFNTWYSISGTSSEMLVTDTSGMGYSRYSFR